MSNRGQQHHDDEQDFELNLVVGSIFTVTPQEDRAAYEEEREGIQELQDLLRENGIQVDLLANPGTSLWEGGIRRYIDLYRLRQLAAYIENGEDFSDLLQQHDVDDDEEMDPLLAKIYEEDADTQYPHLIKHQGEDGYYLPVDFAEPLWIDGEAAENDDSDDGEEDDDEALTSFGSSAALLRELHLLRSYMQQFGIPAKHPVSKCLAALLQGAQISVDNDLPLLIW
jgi:hypothetical protein